MDKKYLYIFTNKNLTASQIAVQSIHSAFELARTMTIENHPSVVLLRAKNQEELLKQKEFIESCGLKTKLFFEPFYNEFTSFAVEPVSEEEKYLFKKFKLIQNTDFNKLSLE
jgi:hypothetical protein